MTRISELDGIRGIAVLMVLVWHYFGSLPISLEPDTLVSYLKVSTRLFWSGVDLFFVLSGFLIGGILLDKNAEENFLKVFWLRRACRIVPVLFILIISYFLALSLVDPSRYQWLFENCMPLLSYATFTQNIAMGFSGSYGCNFFGITWSLAVEEQFYLIAPIIIIAFGKKSWQKLLIPLIFTAVLLRLAFHGFYSEVNTLFRMDSLLIGALLAVVTRHQFMFALLKRNRSTVAWALFIVISTMGAISVNEGIWILKYTWFAMFYALFLLFAILYKDTPLTRALRSPFLRFFGLISYGLYMYHQAVIGMVHGYITGSKPSLESFNGIVATILAVIIPVTIASVSYFFFEKYFLRYGHKFAYDLNSLTNDKGEDVSLVEKA